MIGEGYWSAGISVWRRDGYWFAELDFHDDGFALPDSTEGKLQARYGQPGLKGQVDLLIADASRLGISFRNPTLFWNETKVTTPESWPELRALELARLGWSE